MLHLEVDVDVLNFDLAYAKLKTIIADLYTKHVDILNYSLDTDDLNRFRRLKSETATDSEVQNSLKILMRMFQAVYGKKAILLIDE